MTAFGRSFLANPDLPERIAEEAELNKPEASTYYTPGSEGYTDYSTAASDCCSLNILSSFRQNDMEAESSDAPTPRIDISLQPAGEAELEVVIRDNGKGYTATLQPGRRSWLDFVLIDMLTKQLRGILTILNEDGLTIRLRFPAQYQYLHEKASDTGMLVGATRNSHPSSN